VDIAPVAYTLWQRFLRFDPADPIWPNRGRFVLSEGHASASLKQLLSKFGFTPEKVSGIARELAMRRKEAR
jgi:transketolase